MFRCLNLRFESCNQRVGRRITKKGALTQDLRTVYAALKPEQVVVGVVVVVVVVPVVVARCREYALSRQSCQSRYFDY